MSTKAGPAMKCILAAVDGSEGSMRAVEFAADLAVNFHTELVLICVVEREELPDFALMDVQLDQVRSGAGPPHGPGRFAESFARDALKRARKQALSRGADPIRSEIYFGDAAEEILRFQQQIGADVIVIGSRGRGRLAGLLLGSVSQKIANSAPCTVAIAR
jgi:nucleotide-binding universal stress UspA family protein